MIRCQKLASLIANEKQRIADKWLITVREQIPASRSHSNPAVLDSLMRYLEEILEFLQSRSECEEFLLNLGTARTHGETRVGLGYSVRDVVAEYTILREVLVHMAAAHDLLSEESLTSLNRINDAATINAVEVFLDQTVIARERHARKMAERSEAYFKKVIDSSPAMLWIADEDSLCVYLSKQWFEFTGRIPEDDLGTGWLKNIHPEDLKRAVKTYGRAVEQRGSLRVDYRLRNRMGEFRWVLNVGYPRIGDSGEFLGYIGTIVDIHERVRAEQSLRETKERFDRSAAATDLGVWYCDLPFDVLSWNAEAKSHFFIPPEAQVTIGLFYERIHPEDREPTRKAIAESIANGTPYDTIYRTTNPDKPEDVKHIRAVGWTDYDAEGNPARFDGITLDVSAQVHANREIEEAKAAAELANTAKSAFLANMSHEIRTPLGAIMGYSELAREPGATKEEITSHLAVVERNSAQVLRIIDDILDLAKVEAGRVDLEEIEFSLTEFLADFSSLVGFRARENGISFKIYAETDLPDKICADPTRIRQILTNAVGNAIKFTTKGSVTLHVCHRHGKLTFGIEDTGRGISSEQSAKLFQAFVQADASTTRKFGGTGLGLVLTKRLCQLMGGDYELERSELGVGSKFNASIRVLLPEDSEFVAKNGIAFRAVTQEKKAAPRGRLDQVSILLVEDSPDNQLLIRLILERQGARLDIASNGAQGVEKALAGPYDITLMDIQMPVMDGHEAVQALRAQGYNKPVVALTAHAMKEEAERARQSGFTCLLTKPVQREALVSTIVDLIGPGPRNR